MLFTADFSSTSPTFTVDTAFPIARRRVSPIAPVMIIASSAVALAAIAIRTSAVPPDVRLIAVVFG
jgi:hypothetical protein